MAHFPVDPRKELVIQTLAKMGFVITREREHINLERRNPDGTKTPMTLPNHRHIRSGTLRAALRQSGVDRGEFIRLFES